MSDALQTDIQRYLDDKSFRQIDLIKNIIFVEIH